MTIVHAVVEVTAVEVVGPHRLRLEFGAREVGTIDCSGWQFTGVFAPLADPAYFAQVALDPEIGTITWPSGADVAPDTLHAWACARPAG
jgi:hypothetical protein